MDLKLKGKVSVVTGAGGATGFGRSIAITPAQESCIVAASGIDMKGAEPADHSTSPAKGDSARSSMPRA